MGKQKVYKETGCTVKSSDKTHFLLNSAKKFPIKRAKTREIIVENNEQTSSTLNPRSASINGSQINKIPSLCSISDFLSPK